MKPSAYNVFVPDGEGMWGYNTRSAALVRLTSPEWQRVQRILDGDSQSDQSRRTRKLRDGLIRGQFLVPDDLDELAVLKVKNHISRFASGSISLIIAPTLRCNFACPYCYVDRNASRMKPEVRDRLARFFDSRLIEKAASTTSRGTCRWSKYEILPLPDALKSPGRTPRRNTKHRSPITVARMSWLFPGTNLWNRT